MLRESVLGKSILPTFMKGMKTLNTGWWGFNRDGDSKVSWHYATAPSDGRHSIKNNLAFGYDSKYNLLFEVTCSGLTSAITQII